MCVCVCCPLSHRGLAPQTGRAQRVWDLLPGGSVSAPAGRGEDRAHRQVVQRPEDPLPAEQPHPQDRWDRHTCLCQAHLSVCTLHVTDPSAGVFGFMNHVSVCVWYPENLSRLKKLQYLNLALNNIEVIENLEGQYVECRVIFRMHWNVQTTNYWASFLFFSSFNWSFS